MLRTEPRKIKNSLTMESQDTRHDSSGRGGGVWEITRLSGYGEGVLLLSNRTRIALMLLFLAFLYVRVFIAWVQHLWEDPNYSFGLLVIPLSLLLVWEKRKEISALPPQPSNWGLAVWVAGTVALFAGSLGAELFLTRFSLLVMIAGLCLFLLGRRHLYRIALPLGLLLLVIPLPQLVFGQIAFPLQLLASRLSQGVISLVGIPVLREGNIIFLPHITMGIVEACSGLRSIFSLLALGLLYGHFFEPRRPVQFLLAALTLPIAIAVNMLRIVGTGVLSQHWGKTTAEGFFHGFYGWAHFVVALGLLLAAHQLLLWSGKLWQKGEAK